MKGMDIHGGCKDETGFTSANSELYPISSVRILTS